MNERPTEIIVYGNIKSITEILLFLIVITLCAPMAADPDQSCTRGIALYQQAWRESHNHSWLPLGILRSYERSCNDDSEYRLYYSQIRATLESKVGNHRDALGFNDWRGNSYSAKDLPSSLRAIPAVSYIVEQAKRSKFVIVNERHHAGTDRLLTLELLEPLFSHGFRYLALETQVHQDKINERGYPVASGGYYSNDVVFAQMIRTALHLGFEVVSYEIEDDQRASDDADEPVNRQVERDLAQAENLIARTILKDRDAKVLVHCGYGHVYEKKWNTWSPMAYFLRKLTEIDPLTIEQTELSERSSVSEEHPWRQRADAAGLLSGQPVVLFDTNDKRIDVDTYTDIEVFGLRTDYEHGRPSWMRMGGLREPVWFNTPECVDKACILEAMDPTEDDHAVPYDRVESNHMNRVALFLPPNRNFDIRIMNLDSEILASRSINVPAIQPDG